MVNVFARVVGLFRLASPPVWGMPATVLLGLTGAILEGVGLVLFIPLLQSLGAPTAQNSRFERIFETVDHTQLTGLLVALLCGSIVLKSIVNLINVWVSRSVDGRVAHGLRVRLFEQTLSSCIDFRPDVRRADIATMMTTDTWNVSRGLGIVLGIVVSTITVIVFTALMIGISPLLTLYAVLFLAVAAILVRFATRRADATGRAVVEENKKFGQRMWESIQSLQLIRAFGRETYEADRFQRLSSAVRDRMLKLQFLWAVPGPVSEVSIICLIGMLVLVADRTGVGIASLAAFLSLLYRMQGPVRDLLGSTVALESLWSSIDGVDELLRATARPHLADGLQPAPSVSSAIELRNVSFRYGPDEPWALQDLSLTIPAGKTTAIIGESGAGKSTLLALLFRFQDPTKGTVAVDGVNLASLRIADWRQKLGLMSQEVTLLNDTVIANIAYGGEGAARDDVEAAARIARAHDFIEALPKGYDTIVGDEGLRLSGGQRQRIALARTILRDPDILLLDEATNALDVESEQAFQIALDNYAQRRTVIVIAHRLSTVRNADQIVVLANGRLVEAGAPDTLLKDAGVFARMFNLQRNVPTSRVDA